MESREDHYKRLQKKLAQLEKELDKDKLDLKIERKKTKEAEEKLKRLLSAPSPVTLALNDKLGIDMDKAESNLLKVAYSIINR